MSSILAIKHFFDEHYGASELRIQAREFKSKVNISTYEFETLCSLSNIHIQCLLRDVKIFFRPSKTPMDYFYHFPLGTRHNLSSKLPFEIVLCSKQNVDSTFYDSNFIKRGIVNNSFENATQFYNVYDDTIDHKEVKWGDYKWIFFFSSETLFKPIQSSPFEKTLQSINELLTKNSLSVEKIKFNDLFQLKMSEPESKVLTELILYKNKTEELYRELDKNLAFSLELIHQLIESKTNIFGFNYLNNSIPYLVIDEKIGAVLAHKNNISSTYESITKNSFTPLN